MNEAAFRELLTSVKEAGAVRRGERRPARTTVFRPTGVRAVRAKLGASQAEFALMFGVSVATLRNWEQGRRTPEGPGHGRARRHFFGIRRAYHVGPGTLGGGGTRLRSDAVALSIAPKRSAVSKTATGVWSGSQTAKISSGIHHS